MELLIKRLAENGEQNNSFRPLFFRLQNEIDSKNLETLLHKETNVIVIDELNGQLKELIKSLSPQRKIKEEEYDELVQQHLNGIKPFDYGVWVFYPWLKKLVHLLDEKEFVAIRTNRNQYKITPDEQRKLSPKKIGIIGLSVGQSIALTIAMERTCGELRLADFDTAELSNLNRIRTGVHNLGIHKTIIAAREIAEIDPFLKVKIFSEGITPLNMSSFFEEEGKLDLLVEVCDGLDIKIKSRFKARSLNIPVVMDTNDRGMLDIERFDLEPNRPILHGLAEGLDPENIGDLTNEQKIPYILRMVGGETISSRLKASMMEVEQTINTWPQLASSVVLGGAITTDVCRRILLGEFNDSGRYYVDLDQIISEKKVDSNNDLNNENPFPTLNSLDIYSMIKEFNFYNADDIYELSNQELEEIKSAAIAAPSFRNCQPWKWTYQNKHLFLFHEKARSWTWSEFKSIGANLSFGAALENIRLKASSFNLYTKVEFFPLKNNDVLVAAVTFTSNKKIPEIDTCLSKSIHKRNTNRNKSSNEPISPIVLDNMQQIVASYEGIKFLHVEDKNKILNLSEIISSCDRIRLLNKQGHEEFYNEIRWNNQHAEETRDGIQLSAADMKASDIAGFTMARDWKAVSLLSKWNLGKVFKNISLKSVSEASSIALVTIPQFNPIEIIKAGSAIEKAWIYANNEGVSIQPMLLPIFMFNKYVIEEEKLLKEINTEEIKMLREKFLTIFPLLPSEHEIFLLKLAISEENKITSLRKNKSEIFYS